MKINKALQILSTSVCAAALAGCGFHLAGADNDLPAADLPAHVAIYGLPRYDPLYATLRTALFDRGSRISTEALWVVEFKRSELKTQASLIGKAADAYVYDLRLEVNIQISYGKKNKKLREATFFAYGSYLNYPSDPAASYQEREEGLAALRGELCEEILRGLISEVRVVNTVRRL